MRLSKARVMLTGRFNSVQGTTSLIAYVTEADERHDAFTACLFSSGDQVGICHEAGILTLRPLHA